MSSESADELVPPRHALSLREQRHDGLRDLLVHAVERTSMADAKTKEMQIWSFHQLRHFFCSTLVRDGVSVEAVRVLAGHADLKTTQRYVHASTADLRAAVLTLAC